MAVNTTSGVQTSAPDSTGSTFNGLKLGNAQSFLNGLPGGSLGTFGASQPGLYGLSGLEAATGADLYKNLQPGAYLNNAASALGIQDIPGLFKLGSNSESILGQGIREAQGATASANQVPQQMQDLVAQIAARLQGSLGSLNQNLQGQVGGYVDPSAAIAAGKDYFQQIAAPEIQNNLTASGLGRSGAMAEALARGGAQIALPIAQQTQQLGVNSALNMAALQQAGLLNQGALQQQGGAQAGQLGLANAALQPQLWNQAFNMSLAPQQMQLAGLQGLGLPAAGQDQANLAQAFQLAGVPRQLSLQDFLRQQNMAQALYTGIPVQAGGTISGQNMQNVGGSLLNAGTTGLGYGLASALSQGAKSYFGPGGTPGGGAPDLSIPSYSLGGGGSFGMFGNGAPTSAADYSFY